MDSENPESPGQQPESEEQETISKYYDLKEVDLREPSAVLLQQARELFNSKSTELSLERSLVIGDEAYTLQYSIIPREHGQVWIRVGLFKNQPPETIKNATALNEGEVAMTRLMFNFEKGSVHGEVSTDEHFEGRGFGSALVFMREGIIRDILRRYSDRVPPDGLTSEIIDNSRSLRGGVEYENWASTLAQKMGYEQVDKNKYEKQYEGSEK